MYVVTENGEIVSGKVIHQEMIDALEDFDKRIQNDCPFYLYIEARSFLKRTLAQYFILEKRPAPPVEVEYEMAGEPEELDFRPPDSQNAAETPES